MSSFPSSEQIKTSLDHQVKAIMAVPSHVLMLLPTALSFAVVDYVSEAIIRMIPRASGYAGFIEGNLVNGVRDTIKFATWDLAKA